MSNSNSFPESVCINKRLKVVGKFKALIYEKNEFVDIRRVFSNLISRFISFKKTTVGNL